MKLEQSRWTASAGWTPHAPGDLGERADLVLVFAERETLEREQPTARLREAYPKAILVGCSTAGEISGTEVLDDSIVVTAAALQRSTVRSACVPLRDARDSYASGRRLAGELNRPGLKHVFLLSEGLNVNGSALAAGITDGLPTEIRVTGGLSGDGSRFERTLILDQDGARSNRVQAIGFYGDRLTIGHGCMGGWDTFGPERLVTHAVDNVLYELDGRSALDVYKAYLGPHSDDLPASALRFPLSVRDPAGGDPVVRTILGVDEKSKSMIFAGDIPHGTYSRFMRANFDRLIDGAFQAAEHGRSAFGRNTPELAILISCVGRKLVLKQRVEEEVESVREALGEGAVLAGFYSYGEISPFVPDARCELHNQTMTITTFRED